MITIDDPEIERLVRELAAQNGETVEAAVHAAVVARAVAELPGFGRRAGGAPPPDEHPYGRHDGPLARTPEEVERVLADLARFQNAFGKLPVVDSRSADEMLYDEHGLPV